MRLINVRTYTLEEFYDASIPLYAILSHTWESEEVLFRDMGSLEHAKTKRGFRKIEHVCAQALKDYLEYVWVDTCCIDKSSSAELQEAINSMYRWYANAEYCYVFLSDILGSCPLLADERIGKVLPFSSTPALYSPSSANTRHFRRLLLGDESCFWHDAFSACKWFTRGWTLQELIAPKVLKFFGANWNFVGDREKLTETISKATNIDTDVLYGLRAISSVSAAQKMAWAAGRKTSRVEDQAYALLGLFGVNMPMLYGEGSKAFVRLQEEIMRQSNDPTILAWTGTGIGTSDNSRLLADSPAAFANDHRIVQFGRPDSFEMTNRGLRIRAPILDRRKDDGVESLAILNCRYEDDLSHVLALRLQSYKHWGGYHLPVDNTGASNGPRDLGRLTLVDASELLQAEKSFIEVTRTFESDHRGLRLWLDVSGDAKIVEVQTRGPKIARNCRKTNTSALVDAYEVLGFVGRLGGLLECTSGEVLFVAFGFDTNRPSYNDYEGDVGELAVWLSHRSADRLPATGQLSDLMRTYFRAGGKAAWWNTEVRRAVKLNFGESSVVHAEVALQEVLGEATIVCTVRVWESASPNVSRDVQRE